MKYLRTVLNLLMLPFLTILAAMLFFLAIFIVMAIEGIPDLLDEGIGDKWIWTIVIEKIRDA